MRTKGKYQNKMAGKGKSKGNREANQNKRWIFDDEMTAGLVECLLSYKADKEGEGIDFEGDLVQLYGDIRKRMAEKYEEDNFGPVEHVAATIDVNDMSKEDYKTFKDKFDKDQKSMKIGYDRVKAKIKKIRTSFQKAVLEGTRSGSGRIIKEHWDSLIQIWGGAPGTVPLEYGESSLTGVQPETDNNADFFEEHDVLKLCENEDGDIPLGTDVESIIHDDVDNSLEKNSKEQKKRKCPTALYVDEKRKKLEKNHSSKQRDNAMLQIMKEDLAIKKRNISVEENSKNADSNALMKIADSMQMLSHAIMTGFNSLSSLHQQGQQQIPQQYPTPGTINHLLPHQQNVGNLSYPQPSYNPFPSGSFSLINPGYGFRSVSPHSDTSTTNSNEDV